MEDGPLLISARPPEQSQNRVALIAVATMSVIAVLSIPFLHVRFAALPVFVPVLDTALFVVDGITAVLLYAHAAVIRSRPLLALASGYLFTALIIVFHALTFPGAFAETGLLGADMQTSNYLQIVWRAGLPCAAIAYALLKQPSQETADHPIRRGISGSIVLVAFLACFVLWLTTAGAPSLPKIMVTAETRIWAVDAPFIIPLEIAAIAIVWRRRRSVLDVWLVVVLWAWLIASLLVSTTAYRFSLAWYESRFFGILASSFVLLGLLAQMTTLYTRLAVAVMAQRRQQNNRLAEVDATLAIVSHEINQPLAAIAMNGSVGLDELTRKKPDLGALRGILADVVRDGHRAGEIVGGIRAMFNRGDQEIEELDVAELFESTLALVRAELRAHNISVRAGPENGPLRVVGNRVQLQQVLLNLVMNAIEAMEQIPARSRRLLLRATADMDRVTVDVEDSGPGIDPEIAKAIFDPFFTTKAKGTGLGLSICRSIIEAHGGRINAVPVSPQGTIIRFTLSPPAKD